jgi:hypothetical protein
VAWTETALVILGTVLAALVVILVWLRAAEILEVLRERRRESRITTDIPLELSNLDDPFVRETAPTENISRHGARVLTTTRWRPNDRVFVSSPGTVGRSHAQIAYCNLLPGQSFAVGLKFSSALEDWSPDLQWSDHPQRK